MDLNYLYKRHQIALFMAENGCCARVRQVHGDLPTCMLRALPTRGSLARICEPPDARFYALRNGGRPSRSGRVVPKTRRPRPNH